MKILNDTDGRLTVEMTSFEAFVCRAALREVLYGLTFPDFEPRMGCSRKDAADVFDALPRTSTAEPWASRTIEDRHTLERSPDR